jgi:hypothetical protein
LDCSIVSFHCFLSCPLIYYLPFRNFIRNIIVWR